MMSEHDESFYDSVLITGASGGIGEEFARQLVFRCHQMILVARRENRLMDLAADLKRQNPSLDILFFVVDLTSATEREDFLKMLLNNGAKPDLLINNAGMGDYQRFAQSDWDKIDNMMQVNMTALTHLTHRLIPQMRERGSGAIINVSSLASILPMPEFAVYAATKAYVTSFSEALRLELKEDNIPVMALCPGPVHTEFGSVAMPADAKELPGREMFYVDKSVVVEQALVGLSRHKARVYPGWKVALAAAGISLLPLAVIRLVMSKRLND
ncbi:MAG: SDR family NAD(P)-dependent oxidoreductase [Akkermansiaceae bacterium]